MYVEYGMACATFGKRRVQFRWRRARVRKSGVRISPLPDRGRESPRPRPAATRRVGPPAVARARGGRLHGSRREVRHRPSRAQWEVGRPARPGPQTGCGPRPSTSVVAEAVSAGGRGSADEALAEAASTANEVVAEAASTAAEVVTETASMADEVVAEAASTADEVMTEAASTTDEVVAEATSTADEVVAEATSTPNEVWPR